MSIREDISLGEVKLRALKATTELTGSVTQATSRTTGVTLNAVQGTITTHNASLAAGAEAAFTVTNNRVQLGSIVVVCLRTKSGTAVSIPVVTAVAAGSFEITMSNLDGVTADTSASVIDFFVINAVSGM